MSQSAPTLSVIMPMHNVAPWVDAAIRSILDQSWRDLELIIVDDGSDDASYQIAEAARRFDSRITIVRQSQKGQSAARNRGVDIARGSYIYFLDSDDLLESDALTACMELIREHDLDFVTFSGTAFDDETGKSFQVREFRKPDLLTPQSGQDLFVVLTRQKAFSVQPCLYVFAKSLLREAELRFDEGYLHEDEAFTTILYCTAGRAIALGDCFFRWRVRLESTMTKPRGMVNVTGCIRAATRLAEYLENSRDRLSEACRHALRCRQKSVLRQASINALLCRQSDQLLPMLLSQLGVGRVARIDPLLPAFHGWYLQQRCLGRLR